MEEEGRGQVRRVAVVAIRVVSRVQRARVRGAMGGPVTRENALATGEPAEKFADEDGLFPGTVCKSFWVHLA